MQHTKSYSNIVDINYEANDVKSAQIESIKDDLLTGIINEGEAFGWTFSDVLGYLSEEGITAWEVWTQETLKGAVMPETDQLFRKFLDNAAQQVAETIYKEKYE